MSPGYGLQGVAKAGTHHRQGGDDTPLPAGLRQPGRLKKEGSQQCIQAQKAHPQYAQGSAIRLVADVLNGNDGHSAQKSRG